MNKWEAFGPVSINLGSQCLSHGDFSIFRYDEHQLNEFLKDDYEYWSPVSLSISYKSAYWVRLIFERQSGVEPWNTAINGVKLHLEACGLFKSALCVLALAGLRVRTIERAHGQGGHFGWENTIMGRPYYFLKSSEYEDFLELLNRYEGFWGVNKVVANSSEQLKRINLARYYFAKNFQTIDLIERYVFLSIALEALYGGGQGELKYRYANRAALLLGDDAEKSEATSKFLQDAYDKRSDILHGRTSWKIEPSEVLVYTEIIRQSILRQISLYTKSYSNICKELDDCIFNPTKHARLLDDARALFGNASDYKGPAESYKHHGLAIRK